MWSKQDNERSCSSKEPSPLGSAAVDAVVRLLKGTAVCEDEDGAVAEEKKEEDGAAATPAAGTRGPTSFETRKNHDSALTLQAAAAAMVALEQPSPSAADVDEVDLTVDEVDLTNEVTSPRRSARKRKEVTATPEPPPTIRSPVKKRKKNQNTPAKRTKEDLVETPPNHELFCDPDYAEYSYAHTLTPDAPINVWMETIDDWFRGKHKNVLGRAELVVWPEMMTLLWDLESQEDGQATATRALEKLAKATHDYLLDNAKEGTTPVLLVPLYCVLEEGAEREPKFLAEQSTIAGANKLRKVLVFGKKQLFTEVGNSSMKWGETGDHRADSPEPKAKHGVTWISFTPAKYTLEDVYADRLRLLQSEAWRNWGPIRSYLPARMNGLRKSNEKKQPDSTRTTFYGAKDFQASGGNECRLSTWVHENFPGYAAMDLIKNTFMPEGTQVLFLTRADDPSTMTGSAPGEAGLAGGGSSLEGGIWTVLAMAAAVQGLLTHVVAPQCFSMAGLSLIPRNPPDELFEAARLKRAKETWDLNDTTGKSVSAGLTALAEEWALDMHLHMEKAMLVDASLRFQPEPTIECAGKAFDNLTSKEDKLHYGETGEDESDSVGLKVKAAGKGMEGKDAGDGLFYTGRRTLQMGDTIIEHVRTVVDFEHNAKNYPGKLESFADTRATPLKVFVDPESLAAKLNDYEGFATEHNAKFVEMFFNDTESSSFDFKVIATGKITSNTQVLIDYGPEWDWYTHSTSRRAKTKQAKRNEHHQNRSATAEETAEQATESSQVIHVSFYLSLWGCSMQSNFFYARQ